MSHQAKWDVPTRLLHWTIAACMLALLFSGLSFEGLEDSSDKGYLVKLKYAHLYVGIVLAAAVVCRLLWGFVGNDSVNWRGVRSGIARYPEWTNAEIRFLLRGQDSESRKKTGHNPLAIPVYLFVLVMTVIQTLTGLAMREGLDSETRESGVAVISPTDIGQGTTDLIAPNVYADEHQEGNEQDRGRRHKGKLRDLDRREEGKDDDRGEREEGGEAGWEEVHEGGLFWVPLFLVLHLGGIFVHYLRGEKGLLWGMLLGR